MRYIFLDLDTLRADHLGCYGYHRNTSPNIDKIAEESTKFTNYYTANAPCLPQRSSLVTGQFGIRHGCVDHGGKYASIIPSTTREFKHPLEYEGLWGIWRHSGYRTVTISPFITRHSSWHWGTGFDEIYCTQGTEGACPPAEKAIPIMEKWLSENGESDNWMLHINLWDAHTPYQTPEDYPNYFESDPLPDWITEDLIEEHKKLAGPHCIQEISMYSDAEDPRYPKQPGRVDTMEDMKKLFDGYDLGIRYMDDVIGRIIEILQKQGVYDDTAIIITSDHGENMGELGIYSEHATADHITCRLPLIIKHPDMQKNTTVDGLYYNIDLVPTMAEILDYDRKGDWDGKSFAPVLKSGIDEGYEALVLSQMSHVCQRSVRFDDYIYIRTYHDGYHFFPKHMLFNIKEDPHEQHNLAETHSDLILKAESLLFAWYDEMMEKKEDKVDPMWEIIREGGPFHTKGKLPNYCSYLEKTGRGHYIERYQKKHPNCFT